MFADAAAILIALGVGALLLLGVVGVVGVVALGRCLPAFEHGPRPGDSVYALLYRFVGWYCRVVHNLEVRGHEHVIDAAARGRLIVVANHTAGVDPLMIQIAVPFDIRWMMAEDMRLSILDPFWRFVRIVFVRTNEQDARSSAGRADALREAMRHIETGGVLGLFPEGGLERPPESVLPFMPGVTLLVRRTRAAVLPVIIEGTPQVDPAWASLWHRSRSRVTFCPVIESDAWPNRGKTIAEDLRAMYAERTGWPLNDQPRRDGLQKPGRRSKSPAG